MVWYFAGLGLIIANPAATCGRSCPSHPECLQSSLADVDFLFRGPIQTRILCVPTARTPKKVLHPPCKSLYNHPTVVRNPI